MTDPTTPVDLDRLDAVVAAAGRGERILHVERVRSGRTKGLPSRVEIHCHDTVVAKSWSENGVNELAMFAALRNAYEPLSAELRALRAEVETLRGLRNLPHVYEDAEVEVQALRAENERLRAVRDAGNHYLYCRDVRIEEVEIDDARRKLAIALNAAAGGA